MKNFCIKNFSFLPSDYDSMVTYLNEMLAQGWRLKWVKAGFGGFERITPPSGSVSTASSDSVQNAQITEAAGTDPAGNAGTPITYVVEPYPNTNLMTLRRMPKTWLNFYTGNHWYYIGKTRGNYIYCTDLADPEPPSSTSSMGKNNSKAQVLDAETKRNMLMIIAVILLCYWLSGSKAFMYAFVLTNTYQYLAVLLLVLLVFAVAAILLYSLEKVRLQARTFTPDSAGGLKRGMLYHIRNTVIAVLLLGFFLMETAGTPAILFYLLLPVAALILGGAVIIKIAQKDTSREKGRKLLPLTYAAGAVVVCLLLFSMTGIQRVNSAQKAAALEASLAKADALPLLRYRAFFDDLYTPRSKENNSHLGSNYLYEEANEDRSRIVFTNYSSMKTGFGADCIYNYLFSQAQTDYLGVFEKLDTSSWETGSVPDGNPSGNNISADAHAGTPDKTAMPEVYKITDRPAYLIRKGNTVILATVTEESGGAGDAAGSNASDERILEEIKKITAGA